jgi:hypothetical protein
MARKKKPKKESAGAVLRRVNKEMHQPRFVESARKEEVANHHTRVDATNRLKP